MKINWSSFAKLNNVFKIFVCLFFFFQGRNNCLLRITIEIIRTLLWMLEIYRSLLYLTDIHTHIYYYRHIKILTNNDLIRLIFKHEYSICKLMILDVNFSWNMEKFTCVILIIGYNYINYLGEGSVSWRYVYFGSI